MSSYTDPQDKLSHNLRPYKNRFEFDLNYPISYRPYIGIVDNNTNEPISASLPFVRNNGGNSSSSGGSGASGSGIGFSHRLNPTRLMKPLVSKPLSDNYKKNIYSDLEFKEYFDIVNLKQLFISSINSIISNYLKLLISQPFEISKILLQIGSFEKKANIVKKARRSSTNSSSSSSKNESIKLIDSSDTSDSDSEYEDYSRSTFFKPINNDINSSNLSTPSGTPRIRSSNIQRSPLNVKKMNNNNNNNNNSKKTSTRNIDFKIEPKTLNTFDIITSLISKEGPRGIFKAVNTSFLMNTIQYTLESWISGFLSGIIGIPDPLFIDLIHSSNINYSIMLSILSNVISQLIIIPFNLIRLNFIITNSNTGIRSFREIIKNLPNFYLFNPPLKLILPTLFTNLIKSITLNYPNYILINNFKINNYNSPILYNFLLLSFKIIGLFIRLPFETLLTRCQVNYLINDSNIPKILKIKSNQLCIKFGGYFGYLSTLYYIIIGSKPIKYNNQLNLEIEDLNDLEMNKGIPAIFRGWKVSMVQLISKFFLELSNNSENLLQEKF